MTMPFGAHYHERSSAVVAQQYVQLDSKVERYGSTLLSEWDVDVEPPMAAWRHTEVGGGDFAFSPLSRRIKSRSGSLPHWPVTSIPVQRPEHLPERVRIAADNFDASHHQRTARANEMLRQLALVNPSDMLRGEHFDRGLVDVARHRLRVDGEKLVIKTFAKKKFVKKKALWTLPTSIWKDRVKLRVRLAKRARLGLSPPRPLASGDCKTQ